MPQRPTRGNNQPPTPPEINLVAFQAAVSTAVTVALAQIHNGNNGGGNGQGAGMFEICGCPDEVKVKFATCTFVDQALTWWNGHVEAMTLPVANAMPWT
ncbi:unnamed protein product [Lactuca virosa]|uniref:Reverse transcriptase domain-containing protein n=1 Tax=Lactuca virosa TaxID=75947 RepID=A0AAU9M0S4_9ASTR|nr:unnamed protein product [Lactuca virosa]